MKQINLLLFILSLVPLFGLQAQKSLIGDTINEQIVGDTTYREITDVPKLSKYVVIGGGYLHDSVSTEVFFLRKKNGNTLLIVAAEKLRKQDSIYSNLVTDIVKTKLEDNQKIEFQFCDYKGQKNGNIISQMEEGDTKHLYDIVVNGWEYNWHERKLVKVDPKEIYCDIDER